jgi:hypothetical protein
MPIRLFTADRMHCLQPRYRSVVWMERCPSRNWISSNSPRRVAQPSTCLPEIVRCEPLDARFAGVLAACCVQLVGNQEVTAEAPPRMVAF